MFFQSFNKKQIPCNWSQLNDIKSKIQRPDVYKPLMLMFLLMFCQQFSGVATLTYYAVSIMEESGSGIDSYDATILYGVIRSVQ